MFALKLTFAFQVVQLMGVQLLPRLISFPKYENEYWHTFRYQIGYGDEQVLNELFVILKEAVSFAVYQMS